MARLIENVRADGELTSTVLVCPHPDGDLEILSGHHRTKAAVLAGLPEVTVQVITSPLTEQQKIAIQLSHNSIVGSDDPNILQELYAALDLGWKQYSGLTDDDVMSLKGISLSGVGAGAIEYQEVALEFLPADLEIVERVLRRFEKERTRKSAYLLGLASFDDVFETLVRQKRHFRVTNSAVAFAMICDLANERLDQIEGAHSLPEAGDQSADENRNTRDGLTRADEVE